MKNPFNARFARWLASLLGLLLSMALASCMNDADEEVVVQFNLDTTQLGRSDSLVFLIYNGKAPAPGSKAEPVQEIRMKTPKGRTRVDLKLSGEVGKDFSIVAIGLDASGKTIQTKLIEVEDFTPPKDGRPMVLIASLAVQDLELQVGDARAMKVSLAPSDASDKRYSCSSSDTTVVKVRDTLLLANAGGSATITCQAMVGGAKAAFKVVVKTTPAVIKVKRIEAKALSGLVGDKLVPDITLLPADADDKTFSLRSRDSSVAAIESLKVVGRAEGKTRILVISTDGGGVDSFEVTISRQAIKLKAMTANDLRVLVGDTTRPELTFDPADATNRGFVLRSLDEEVVKVHGDSLIAGKLGTANIEAVSEDGAFKATFKVNVSRPAFKVDVLPITTRKCAPCHIPGQIFNFQDSVVLLLKGSSSLDRVQRELDAPGKMPLKGSANGDLSPRELTLLVAWIKQHVVPLKGMTAKDMALTLGDKVAPDLTWDPADATNRKANLTSIDSAVVGITEDGKIETRSVGQTTILAESDEGGLKAQIKVTVGPPAFTRNVLPITTLKCAPCHVSGQTFNYQDSLVLAFEGAKVMERIQRDSLAPGKMPLRGAQNGDLTPVEKQVLLAWLKIKVVPLKGITVADDSVLVGAGKAPAITFDPINANNKSYVLGTEDTALIEIDGTQFIGKAVGTATLTVRALDGDHEKTFKVKVIPVPVASVSATDTAGAIGDTVVPKVLVLPENAAVKTYTLSLLRPSTVVQLIPAKLAVVGLSLGKDTVVITSTQGAKVGRFVFAVGPVLPKAMRGVDTNVTLGSSAVPRMIWSPTNVTNKAFTLSIAPADTGVAALRAGNAILGKALGTVLVTARSVADTSLRDVFNFTVGPVPVISVSAQAHPNMACSSTVLARPFLVFNPLNATNKGFRLVSSAPMRLEVINDTTVKALGLGLTGVTVTSVDGAKTATWNVTVIRNPFSGAVKNAITIKCGGCHFAGGPYSNWQDSATAVTGRLNFLSRINAPLDTRMPPSTSPQLTTTPNGGELKTLRDWFSVQ